MQATAMIMAILLAVPTTGVAVPEDLPGGWDITSIGFVQPPGQTRTDRGKNTGPADRWYIAGAGAGVGNPDGDSFHFTFREMEGDFVFTVRVVGIGDEQGQLGIMLRETLEPHARYQMIEAVQTYRSRASNRIREGEQPASNNPLRLDTQPAWLRIARAGNQIGLWYSHDGDAWRYSRFSSTLRDLPDRVYIGMVATAARGEAIFDQVTVHSGVASLGYRTSWLANTLPGGGQWVQAGVSSIFLEPVTGRLFTVGSDEIRGAHVYDSNGRHLATGDRSHFAGGSAVVADENYFYHGEIHTRRAGLRRYTHDGRVADAPNWVLEGRRIRGLAIHGDRLYAANEENRVAILDRSTLQLAGEFPVERPGNIAVDADGNLWIIRRAIDGQPGHVLCYQPDGTPLAPRITGLANPHGLAIHPQTGRIYVADRDGTLQIHIFDRNGSPHGSFGAAGGIYSRFGGTLPGQVHPLKLNHPTGVAIDAAGNLFVAASGPVNVPWANGTGTQLRKFDPGGTLLWSHYGLVYIDQADPDRTTDGTDVYTRDHRFRIDYTRQGGEEWSYHATTIDPRAYPDDPRLMRRAGPVFIRNIDGRRLLYVMEMKSRAAAMFGYLRFSADSEIAIPSGGMIPDRDGRWMQWHDDNGDGQMDDLEWRDAGEGPSGFIGWYVDDNGGIWCAARDHIRYFSLEGFDAHGSPIYSDQPQRWDAPAAFTGPGAAVKRLHYDPHSDTLYLGGFTRERPRLGPEWAKLGSTIVRYDRWLTGEYRHRWTLPLPYQPKVRGRHEDYIVASISVAGDYLFTIESASSLVRAYDLEHGQHVATLKPGPEVGGVVGLIDVAQGISAMRRENGEYVIFTEDGSRAKVVIFRWDGKSFQP